MNEIKGTEHDTGWNGLVERIGYQISDRRPPYSLNMTTGYAQRLIAMAEDPNSRYVLNAEISDIDFLYCPESIRNRTFVIDADGRSRTMVLKALQNMGCDVNISGIKVGLLE